METVARQSRFVTRVREEMATQKLSVRALARRMDPQNLDRARRNLHRWLDEGIRPGRVSRTEVAAALGISPSALEGEDEDEESDLAIDLMDVLTRFIDARWKALA